MLSPFAAGMQEQLQIGYKAKLLFTDTDSLCYHIRTDNVFEDQKARSELFDLSNYPSDSPYYDASHESVYCSQCAFSFASTCVVVVG